MKVGDMIYDFCHDQTGLIIAMPNMALQTYMTVLYEDGDVIPDGKAIGEIKEEKATVKSLKYSILYMKAIKALQEAQTRIETLETKVKTLEDA